MSLHIHNDGKGKAQSWEAVWVDDCYNIHGSGAGRYEALRNLCENATAYWVRVSQMVEQAKRAASDAMVEA